MAAVRLPRGRCHAMKVICSSCKRCSYSSECLLFALKSDSFERNCRPKVVEFEPGESMDAPWEERKYNRMLEGASVTALQLMDGEKLFVALNLENDVKDDPQLELTALTRTRACVFSYTGFRAEIDADPKIAALYADTFKMCFTAVMRMLWIDKGKTLSEKLLRLFSALKACGVMSEDGVLRIKHRDIASMLNASRTAVTETLKQLKLQGYIECGYGKVTILDKVDAASFDQYSLG